MAEAIYNPLCLGAQSFEHANVLSEKNNFSALGGPKVTIFGRDDLDPLYFDVSIFSVPPDPPYMSKNTQICYFHHFLGVPFKIYPQNTGPAVKILTLFFRPNFWGEFLYMYA